MIAGQKLILLCGMWRIVLVFSFALFLVCGPVYSATMKVAVVAFDSITKSAAENNFGRIVSEKLSLAAVQSGSFSVVERHMVDQVLSEMEYGNSGLSGSNAQKIGTLVNADYVMLGTVAQLGSELDIVVKVVAVESGEIVLAENGYAQASLKSVAVVTNEIVERMSRIISGESAGSSTKSIVVNSKINDFLAELFDCYLQNDMDILRKYYADVVMFFDQGQLSLEKIIAEKKKYLRRWPRRESQIYNLKVVKGEDGVFRVNYNMHWRVSNESRSLSGTLEAELVVAEQNGVLRVVGENSRVLTRD